MTRNSAFLFYSEAFLTGTAILSHEDRGKYITILCQMHQSGKLTESDINNLVGPISEQLRKKFEVDKKGYWHNVRLERETIKRERFVNSREENGRNGGRPKSGLRDGDSANAISRNNNPNETLSPLGEEGGANQRNEVQTSPMQAIFNKWIAYRKSIRKPLKEQSLDGAFKRLQQLSDNDPTKAEAIVNFSISNGYQGLFAPKENKYKPHKTFTEEWLA